MSFDGQYTLENPKSAQTKTPVISDQADNRATKRIKEIKPTQHAYHLSVPAINLSQPLLKTSLDANRRLMVPKDASQAAYYTLGPKPGEAGTTVITGHLDERGGLAGVFYNLNKLKPKDRIVITDVAGKVMTYEVEKSEVYKQDMSFPWSKVYQTTGPSKLRIITCHGTYNQANNLYSHNLVVYANLVSSGDPQ